MKDIVLLSRKSSTDKLLYDVAYCNEEIKKILSDYQNKINLEQLIQALSDGKVVPYIGAGFSNPFRYPTWTDFLKKIAVNWKFEKEINDFLDEKKYEEAADFLYEELEEAAFLNEIKLTFGKNTLKIDKFDKAIMLVPYLTKGPVITTNYDYVLEKVYEYTGMGQISVVLGARADSFNSSLRNREIALLKIHGHAEDRVDRILTKKDYEKYFATGAILPNLLLKLFTHYSVLFLGCSLEQDRVMEILRKSFEEGGAPQYAIVGRDCDKKKWGDRRKILANHGINPIWYPEGRYDFIEPILGYVLRTAYPNNPVVSVAIAYSIKNYETAIKEGRKYLEEYPKDPLVRTAVSYSLIAQLKEHFENLENEKEEFFEQGGPGRFIMDSSEAICIKGEGLESKLFRIYRGIGYLLEGNHVWALKDLDSANTALCGLSELIGSENNLELIKTKGLVLGLLGWGETLGRNYKKAISLFEKVCDLIPEMSDEITIYFRRTCYIAQADKDWAMENLRTRIKKNPQDIGAQKLYSEISNMGFWDYYLFKRLESEFNNYSMKWILSHNFFEDILKLMKIY